MLTTTIGGSLGVLALLLCMTIFLISDNTDLVLLVVIPAMKNVRAIAGLMKMATLPEINMEYWMEYRDLILVKWVPDMGCDIDGNDRHYGAQLRALIFAWAICIKYYQVSTHLMVGITLWPSSTLSRVT
ncbi:hypothetical protein DSO57_1019099 [Entomophthora muscae]|uniref:Uncharacterized protein n=1 Tax=Entomophthora muscae TaxID=34485 RepID=A0ACC2TF40_9FUNG|nr:hypothetical protein DSO57_1019099 [Entomophthora muscae]